MFKDPLSAALLILASTLSLLLIGSLIAIIASERFMTGGTAALTVILGTASTVFTALAGGAYFANYVKKAADEEGAIRAKEKKAETANARGGESQ